MVLCAGRGQQVIRDAAHRTDRRRRNAKVDQNDEGSADRAGPSRV
jgi:IS5 family transposase